MINRIIDVNLNRCMESLRILEDINRFYLNQKAATLSLKNSRHSIMKHFKLHSPLAITGRDTKKDTAKFLNTPSEFKRNDLTGIIKANSGRLQESSRVLEEFLKLNDTKGAVIFKKIRFFAYDLEKKILSAIKKEIDLSLYVIIDTEFTALKHIEKTVIDLLSGGATVICLKAGNLETSAFLKTAKKIKNITKGSNKPFIINSRIDIAIASEADGIHVGPGDIQPDVIRKKFFYNKIIGYSASREKDIIKGIKYNADYIGLEPASGAGKEIHPMLIKVYQKYKEEIPIVITGGLSPRMIKICLKAGIKNFALTSGEKQ